MSNMQKFNEVMTTATPEDWELCCEHTTEYAISEVLRSYHSLGSRMNPPKLVKADKDECYYVKADNILVPFYKVFFNGLTFKLYELSYKAYNRFGF